MKTINWSEPHSRLEILDNQVHIWRANLKISDEQIANLNSILSQDEQQRANRFKFLEHRNRFIAARGFLRQIISYYLNLPSQNIVFNYSVQGKPKLANSNLQFNVSHSQDIALYAVTKNHLIGIDIEYLRTNVEYNKIAQRFFTQQESQLIINLNQEKKIQFFFHLWTIKEAFLKATGEGLVGGLDTVEIDINQTSEVKLLAIAGDRTIVDDWLFSSFIPENNFIATVAIKAQKQALKIKNFLLN